MGTCNRAVIHMDRTNMDLSRLIVGMYIYTIKLEIFFFYFQCFFLMQCPYGLVIDYSNLGSILKICDQNCFFLWVS